MFAQTIFTLGVTKQYNSQCKNRLGEHSEASLYLDSRCDPWCFVDHQIKLNLPQYFYTLLYMWLVVNFNMLQLLQ